MTNLQLELQGICTGLGVEYAYDSLNHNVHFYRKPSTDMSVLLTEVFGDGPRVLVINRNRVVTLVRNGWMAKILSSWVETGRVTLDGAE